QAHMVDNGGTTAIDLGSGDFIVVNGVAAASLTANDFVFKAGGAAEINDKMSEMAMASPPFDAQPEQSDLHLAPVLGLEWRPEPWDGSV
ncbi:MAG TPA: hypothetical protein VFN88_01215, partial [Caulobacteraceae bacterium]|nr:hypothetical protein [Caulobacteraceae bacterium]